LGDKALLAVAALIGAFFLLVGNRACPGAMAGAAVIASLARTMASPALFSYGNGWLPTEIEIVHPVPAYGCMVLAAGVAALIAPLFLVRVPKRYAGKVAASKTTSHSIPQKIRETHEMI
jgi:hypothetical protein